MSLVLASIAFVLAVTPTLANDVKVKVEVMVESFCPCSGAWENGFLEDIVPQIANLIEVDRFFDAAAKGTQGCCNPSANASASCMHGRAECVADSLQRCVQAHYPDWKQWLSYTACINGPCTHQPDASGCKTEFIVGSEKNLALEQECAKNHTMSYEVISNCWKGSEGVALMQQDADRGDAKVDLYGKEGLPVVWINGTLLSHFFDCDISKKSYQDSLIKAVCDASLVTPVPEVCKSHVVLV
jgi:hypothetical protein